MSVYSSETILEPPLFKKMCVDTGVRYVCVYIFISVCICIVCMLYVFCVCVVRLSVCRPEGDAQCLSQLLFTLHTELVFHTNLELVDLLA